MDPPKLCFPHWAKFSLHHPVSPSLERQWGFAWGQSVTLGWKYENTHHGHFSCCPIPIHARALPCCTFQLELRDAKVQTKEKCLGNTPHLLGIAGSPSFIPNPTVPTLKEADSRVESSKVYLEMGWASVLCSKAKLLNQKINYFPITFIIPPFFYIYSTLQSSLDSPHWLHCLTLHLSLGYTG